MLLAVGHMKSARLEFPLVAGLGVFVFVEAGPRPFEILLGVAQFDVASAGRAPAALEVDNVIMDIGAREHVTRGQGRIHLQQLGAARGFVLALAAHHDKRPVVGEEIDEAGDVAAPYAIAIALRQLADRVTIREFGQRLFDTLCHEYFLPNWNAHRAASSAPIGRRSSAMRVMPFSVAAPYAESAPGATGISIRRRP